MTSINVWKNKNNMLQYCLHQRRQRWWQLQWRRHQWRRHQQRWHLEHSDNNDDTNNINNSDEENNDNNLTTTTTTTTTPKPLRWADKIFSVKMPFSRNSFSRKSFNLARIGPTDSCCPIKKWLKWIRGKKVFYDFDVLDRVALQRKNSPK